MLVPTYVQTLSSGSAPQQPLLMQVRPHLCHHQQRAEVLGEADAGQLGDGQAVYNQPTPQTVSSFGTGISTLTSQRVGNTHVLRYQTAISRAGAVGISEYWGQRHPTAPQLWNQFNLSTNGTIVALCSECTHAL